MVALLFLGILAGATVYLSDRVAGFFSAGKAGPFYGLFGALTVYMIPGVVIFSHFKGMASRILYSLAAILMGFLLYFLLAVVLTDLLRLMIRIPPGISGMAALLLALGVSGYAAGNAYWLKTRKISICIGGLKKKARILHLTDIHLGHFRGSRFLQRLVDLANRHEVDMVLITGDLFDGRSGLKDRILEPLKQVDAPAYYVEGNHDIYTGVEQVKQLVRETGIRVLSNEMVIQGEFRIIGLNNMRSDPDGVDMHGTGNPGTIRSVLEEMHPSPDMPTILMHHSPNGIEYAHAHSVDLYLAGHTHAGQLFPVTLIMELLYRFNKGLHDYRGMKIYVGEGAGTFGPPMRLGTRASVTLFRLEPCT
jgi:predicted MPP superfamily phosphohydrolase